MKVQKHPKKINKDPNLLCCPTQLKPRKKIIKKSTLSMNPLSPSSISKQKTKAKKKKKDIINKISNKANGTLGRMDDSW